MIEKNDLLLKKNYVMIEKNARIIENLQLWMPKTIELVTN